MSNWADATRGLVPLEQVGTPVPLWLPAFLSPLRLTYLDGHNWAVLGCFTFESAVLRAIVAIEEGFITDFASTPRSIWNVLPPTGPWGKPSVVHDKLYRTPGLATKDQADRVFLEAMTVLGVRKEIRDAMYEGVHLFGGSSYKGGL